MTKKKAIGIFGGTFDPIHFGHLRAAEEIFETLGLDEMRLIPCKLPPHRGTPIATANHRLAMVQLAVANSHLTVDDREMHRDGPSYSVDTLTTLRCEFPKASLCLVVGVDAFVKIQTWYQWEKLIQLANIIVVQRGGWNTPTSGPIIQFLAEHSLRSDEKIIDFPSGKIVQQIITALEISASAIRSLIHAGRSVDFLLPSSVIEYIQQHQLYGFGGDPTFTQPTEIAPI